MALSSGACGSTSSEDDESTVIDGGGGTGGGGDQCKPYCTKLMAAGCAPPNCASDCTSQLTCVGPWIAIVSCVAEKGTVTCNAGQPAFKGCNTQAQSYANCENQSSGGTGGRSPGSCSGHCGQGSPVPGSNPDCYCDSICEEEGDCCEDKATECPGASRDGVCKKYCCASSDCGAGQTCEALDAGLIGTLGVCTGVGGAAGGPAVDSGSPGDGGNADAGTGLPAGCLFEPDPLCNPVTNAPCGPGEACDSGDEGVECFGPPNRAQPGGECSSRGPFCIGGYHCAPP